MRSLQKRLEAALPKALKSGVDADKIAARVNAAIERREKAFQKASGQARETQKPQDLHAARIAGKKLRYALEAADRIGVGHVQDRIEALAAVQDQLGNWNDLEVLEEALVSFCSKKGRIRKHTKALRALYGAILQGQQSKARYLDAFLKTGEGSAG